MAGESILSLPKVVSPTLDIGRAYSAKEAAAILGVTESTFNERVREGLVKPVFDSGDRRYSGYVLAKLLGWPDKLQEYMPRRKPVERGYVGRRFRSIG